MTDINLEDIVRQEVRAALQGADLGKAAELEAMKAKLALTEEEVSALLGMSRSTLQKDRANKRGLRYFQTGKSVFYRTADVLEFMSRHMVRTRDHE